MKRIIIFLLVFALLISIPLFLLLSKQAPSPITQPAITPTPFPTQSISAKLITPTPVEDRLVPSENFLSNLPYQSDDFLIEYFAPERTVVVTLTASPIEETKTKAVTWMGSHGLTQVDTYTILYVHSRYAN